MPIDTSRSDYQRIYATVDAIPRGRVATYGQVAREAGLPRNARQVGFALRHLPADSELPWHRVVNAGGEISGRGKPDKERRHRRLLEREGIDFGPRDRVDLRRFGWRPD